MEHAHGARAVVVRLTTALKTKCGGPRFDSLVHHARSCDDNSVKEVALTVTTALYAWRTGPDCAPTGHKIVDEFSEGFERIDLSGIGSALPHKIDATAAQKDENLQSGCNPAVCNGKWYRGGVRVTAHAGAASDAIVYKPRAPGRGSRNSSTIS